MNNQKQPPINKWKSGKIELCQWAGEYDGKPTTSYSVSKRNYDKATGQWKESKILGIQDLKDLGALINVAVTMNIVQKPAKQPMMNQQGQPIPQPQYQSEPTHGYQPSQPDNYDDSDVCPF